MTALEHNAKRRELFRRATELAGGESVGSELAGKLAELVVDLLAEVDALLEELAEAERPSS